ncbi:hypothetical protein H5410_003865 [Solanum commersonii]|uniref:Uncharacterized protein n=1 Tax=Solanum commersonii TaxID=4109 RepID=A0A9J6B6F3_SOLCO|nr:hypothetical protein H5410_003865 [Solanum commersonii]
MHEIDIPGLSDDADYAGSVQQLFIFEFRGSRLLISEQFLDTAVSIVPIHVDSDSDVMSLNGRQVLGTEAELKEDGKLHVTERRHRKQIVELTTVCGAKIEEPDEIRKEIITFYQSLMGTAMTNITAVSRAIMKTGPTLNHTQQLTLCEEITEKEIYDGLCSIGDDKVPASLGLQANLSKSAMYFGGVSGMVQSQIQQDLGYSFGELPFRYLGVPLATKKLSIVQWQPLIVRIVAKISSWIAKKLSYAGRVQLVKTVIFGVQAYWAQIFVLPSKVMKIIQAYCRSYIWLRANVITKRALVSWDKMCTPKSAGRLNLVNLKVWNKAAILKICWDIEQKQDRLWIKWIHSYYIKGQSMEEVRVPAQACWIVRKILGTKEMLHILHNEDVGKKSMIRQAYKQMLGSF